MELLLFENLVDFVKYTETETSYRLCKLGNAHSKSLNVGEHIVEATLPGDSRSWESPEKTDNVWRLFIQILLR